MTPKSIFPIFFLQAGGALTSKITSLSVFWSFLKVGAVLYGSGYVLFAYLDAELVARDWLTRPELIDAIAAGGLFLGFCECGSFSRYGECFDRNGFGNAVRKCFLDA